MLGKTALHMYKRKWVIWMSMLTNPLLLKIHTLLDIKHSHSAWVVGCQLPQQLSECHLNSPRFTYVFQCNAKRFPLYLIICNHVQSKTSMGKLFWVRCYCLYHKFTELSFSLLPSQHNRNQVWNLLLCMPTLKFSVLTAHLFSEQLHAWWIGIRCPIITYSNKF